jgi:hypothetical protein
MHYWRWVCRGYSVKSFNLVSTNEKAKSYEIYSISSSIISSGNSMVEDTA